MVLRFYVQLILAVAVVCIVHSSLKPPLGSSFSGPSVGIAASAPSSSASCAGADVTLRFASALCLGEFSAPTFGCTSEG